MHASQIKITRDELYQLRLQLALLEKNNSDVENLLTMAKVLEELNITNLPDCKSGTLREDEASEPCAEGGYIIVPKVVGE